MRAEPPTRSRCMSSESSREQPMRRNGWPTGTGWLSTWRRVQTFFLRAGKTGWAGCQWNLDASIQLLQDLQGFHAGYIDRQHNPFCLLGGRKCEPSPGTQPAYAWRLSVAPHRLLSVTLGWHAATSRGQLCSHQTFCKKLIVGFLSPLIVFLDYWSDN